MMESSEEMKNVSISMFIDMEFSKCWFLTPVMPSVIYELNIQSMQDR